MKIRNGFVSNSSSSSFVVGFKTIPRNAEEVLGILFGENKEFYSSPFYDDRQWPTTQVAETVWTDMKDQLPLTKSQFFRATEDMASIDWNSEEFETIEKTRSDGSKYMTTNWVAQEAAQKKESKTEASKFLEKNTEYYYYSFSYADEDGPYGCDLEHGDLFSNLPHIRISQH